MAIVVSAIHLMELGLSINLTMRTAVVVSEGVMQPVLDERAVDRLESLKAGLIASVGGMGSFGLLLGVNLGLGVHWRSLAALTPAAIPGFLIQGLVVALSSFFFGVTYRYAVRGDANPNLKAGVILAFGLVRGLTQGEARWMLDNEWLLAVQGGESLLVFAAAGGLLDLALRRGWVTIARSEP